MTLLTVIAVVGCLSLGTSITAPGRLDPPPIKPPAKEETGPDYKGNHIPTFSIDGKEYPLTKEILDRDLAFFVKLDVCHINFLDKDKLDAAFGTTDKNADGVIDGDEAKASEMEVLLRAGDLDEDGQLSGAEFNALLERMNIDGKEGLYAGEVYAYLKHNGHL